MFLLIKIDTRCSGFHQRLPGLTSVFFEFRGVKVLQLLVPTEMRRKLLGDPLESSPFHVTPQNPAGQARPPALGAERTPGPCSDPQYRSLAWWAPNWVAAPVWAGPLALWPAFLPPSISWSVHHALLSPPGQQCDRFSRRRNSALHTWTTALVSNCY